MHRGRIAILTLMLLSLALTAAAAPGKSVARSDKVERFMVEAHTAWPHIQDSDLPGMEAVLADGLAEIRALVDSYNLNTAPEEQARLNAYLSKRGWGHLVWTQIMVRLLAIRSGVYDRELEFAERVPLESAAREALDGAVASFGTFEVLLEAKDLFGFGEQIDQFAQGLFQGEENVPDYQTMIADSRERFQRRRQVVLARLESRRHRGVVEPARLATASAYPVIYERFQHRLEDDDTRLDEVLHSLAEYDPAALQQLAAAAESLPADNERDRALDAVRVELLKFEAALDVSENDPGVRRMLERCEQFRAVPGSRDQAYDLDFRDAMHLMLEVREALAVHADTDGLREFYTLADRVR